MELCEEELEPDEGVSVVYESTHGESLSEVLDDLSRSARRADNLLSYNRLAESHSACIEAINKRSSPDLKAAMQAWWVTGTQRYLLLMGRVNGLAGETLIQMQQTTKALKFLAEGIKYLSEVTPKHYEHPALLFKYAELLEMEGLREPSLQALSEAETLFLQLKQPDHGGAADCVFSRANVHLSEQSYTLARADFSRAREHFRACKDFDGETEVLVNLGIAQLGLGETALAMTTLGEAVERIDSPFPDNDRHSPRLRALSTNTSTSAFFNYGIALWKCNFKRRAVLVLERALKTGKEQEDDEGCGGIYILIGDIKFEEDHDEEALSAYFKAYAAYEAGVRKSPSASGISGQARAICRSAEVHCRQGREEEALEAFRSGMELWRGCMNRREEAQCLLRVGCLMERLGRFNEAADGFVQAKSVFLELKESRSAVDCILNTGVVCERQGRLDQAEELYVTARVQYSHLGDNDGVSRSHENMGNVFAERGNYDDAITEYQLAQQIQGGTNEDIAGSAIGINIALCLSAQGRFQMAVDELRGVCDVLRDLGDEEMYERAQRYLGFLFEQCCDARASSSEESKSVPLSSSSTVFTRDPGSARSASTASSR